MFISKKKFEEAIRNAQEETAERIYKDRQISDLYEKFYQLENRVHNLEHPNGDKCEKTIRPIGQ